MMSNFDSWIVDAACSECSYPPNFIISTLYSKDRGQYCGVQCRDCGDYWEHHPDNFEKNDE